MKPDIPTKPTAQTTSHSSPAPAHSHLSHAVYEQPHQQHLHATAAVPTGPPPLAVHTGLPAHIPGQCFWLKLGVV